MGTFTNIAKNIFNMSCSGTYATVTKNFSTLQLYEQGTICVYSTTTKSECYCHVSNFSTTALVSGHKYYACYWAKTSSGTYSTDLFIGNSIDSESDHIVGPINVGTSWTRCSGMLIPSDTGSGAQKARVDFNNNGKSGVYMYFSGFLLVDLTNAGIADKSVAWCDDHLYWMKENVSGSFTDYDAEGSGSFASTGTPSVGTLATYHNYAANKSNRSGTTVSSAPSTANASWINTVYNAQVAMTTKGSTYGTCAIVRVKPSNFKNITAPSTGSTSFYTSGRSVVNNLISNADALYAQTYCVQASLKYQKYCSDCENCCDSNCCNSDTYTARVCTRDCCDYDGCSECEDCDDAGKDCCYGDCGADDYCCYSVSYCSAFQPEKCNCDSDDDCFNTLECPANCGCNQVCSCNGVCSCNWV